MGLEVMVDRLELQRCKESLVWLCLKAILVNLNITHVEKREDFNLICRSPFVLTQQRHLVHD